MNKKHEKFFKEIALLCAKYSAVITDTGRTMVCGLMSNSHYKYPSIPNDGHHLVRINYLEYIIPRLVDPIKSVLEAEFTFTKRRK